MSERSDRSSSIDQVESIGAYLAQQRSMRGITAQQLGEITRIPLRSIERLEAGYFDAEPDGFSRGFIRAVAEALGLDPHETLARTLREPSASEFRANLSVAWGRPLAVLLLAALLVGAGALAREVVRGLSSSPRVQPEYVYRRDPVRDLAEAQGPYVALGSTATGVLAEPSLSMPLASDTPDMAAPSQQAEIGDLGR